MSFGGGGGSAGITAHKHTNASGEGSALDNTTLLNSITLNDSIASIARTQALIY